VLGLLPFSIYFFKPISSLAPLRYGAGIKGKIADSFLCGIPVVTTSIGAEGMKNGDDFAGLVCDDAESFAKAAVSLYQTPDLYFDQVRKGKGRC